MTKKTKSKLYPALVPCAARPRRLVWNNENYGDNNNAPAQTLERKDTLSDNPKEAVDQLSTKLRELQAEADRRVSKIETELDGLNKGKGTPEEQKARRIQQEKNAAYKLALDEMSKEAGSCSEQAKGCKTLSEFNTHADGEFKKQVAERAYRKLAELKKWREESKAREDARNPALAPIATPAAAPQASVAPVAVAPAAPDMKAMLEGKSTPAQQPNMPQAPAKSVLDTVRDQASAAKEAQKATEAKNAHRENIEKRNAALTDAVAKLEAQLNAQNLAIDYENMVGETFSVSGDNVTVDVMSSNGHESPQTANNAILPKEAWSNLGFQSAAEAADRLNKLHKDKKNIIPVKRTDAPAAAASKQVETTSPATPDIKPLAKPKAVAASTPAAKPDAAAPATAPAKPVVAPNMAATPPVGFESKGRLLPKPKTESVNAPVAMESKLNQFAQSLPNNLPDAKSDAVAVKPAAAPAKPAAAPAKPAVEKIGGVTVFNEPPTGPELLAALGQQPDAVTPTAPAKLKAQPVNAPVAPAVRPPVRPPVVKLNTPKPNPVASAEPAESATTRFAAQQKETRAKYTSEQPAAKSVNDSMAEQKAAREEERKRNSVAGQIEAQRTEMKAQRESMSVKGQIEAQRAKREQNFKPAPDSMAAKLQEQKKDRQENTNLTPSEKLAKMQADNRARFGSR